MVISILFVSAVLGILLLLDVDERVLRLLTGCAPLPDDEAAWVLETSLRVRERAGSRNVHRTFGNRIQSNRKISRQDDQPSG